MPCGTGKTMVEYMLSLNYLNTVILSPLISTSEQTLSHFKNYYSDSHDINFIEINSSVGRQIKQYNIGTKNIFVSTYNSCDVVNEIIKDKKIKNLLIIIDEFHNLTNNDLINEKSEIKKLINLNFNVLFVSATPKYFEGFDYGNKYKLKWIDAIKNKHICDLNFIFPENEEIEKHIELLKINTSIVSKISLINKAYFLLTKIKDNKCKKNIVFLRTVKECIEFIKIIGLVNAFVELEFESGQITYNISKTKRSDILKKFNESKKIFILCNVHVLDEGIDIPKCDAVYVTNPNNNIINLIQRISRCNRLDKDDPEKKANVLLWAKNNDKIQKITSYIEQTMNIIIAKPTDNKSITSKISNDATFKEISIPKDFIDIFFTKYKIGRELEFDIEDSKIAKYLNITLQTLRNRLSNIYSKKNYILKM